MTGRERGGRDRFTGVTGSGRVGKEEQKEGDIAVTGAAACLTQVGIASLARLECGGRSFGKGRRQVLVSVALSPSLLGQCRKSIRVTLISRENAKWEHGNWLNRLEYSSDKMRKWRGEVYTFDSGAFVRS